MKDTYDSVTPTAAFSASKIEAQPNMSLGDMIAIIRDIYGDDVISHPQVMFSHVSTTGAVLEFGLRTDVDPVRVTVPLSWITNPKY